MECKIDCENRPLNFTQPVMVQSFKDEFDMTNRVQITTIYPGTKLVKAEEYGKVSQNRTTYFRRGVGKLLHMMSLSRPEMYNSVRDLSQHMSVLTDKYVKAMHRVMVYVAGTPLRGWKLRS